MWIVYVDDLGVAAERIDISYGVSILEGTVYYTTYTGVDEEIPLNTLRGFSENDPFYEG